MTKRNLRSVKPGESAPEPEPPKTVTEAAAGGSRRDVLVAMRDRVAKDVENPNTPSRDLAALSKRLIEIINEIEAIDARKAQEDSEHGEAADEEFDAAAL